ncbi:phosphoglycolate phosphatase [Hydrogenimonas sp.]|nr:phosphoglycolate phosphatase [Hydrogenimonas sp.]
MRTVIFDLDGTLVDTGRDLSISINHIRREIYGLPPLPEEKIVELMNRPGLNLAYEFYGVERYEDRARELFEEHYAAQCIKNAVCFDGIRELLHSLANEGVEMFVATNAPTATSLIILENNGIDALFTDVVGADRVTNAKPHPEMLEMIISKRGKELCWMVGDSLKDVMAARSAGVVPVFAEWGFAKSLPAVDGVEKRAEVPADVFDIVTV